MDVAPELLPQPIPLVQPAPGAASAALGVKDIPGRATPAVEPPRTFNSLSPHVALARGHQSKSPLSYLADYHVGHLELQLAGGQNEAQLV